MPKINLAAEVFRARLIARRRRVLYLLSVVLILVAVGGWTIPFFLARAVEKDTQSLEEQIAAVGAQLKRRESEVRAIRQFADRLVLLRERLGQHTGWSRVFQELERLALPPVTFLSLSGSATSGALKAAVGVPSLDVAADLVASLQRARDANETFFSSVAVDSVSLEQRAIAGGYIVGLTLSLSPEHFRLTPAVAATASPGEAGAGGAPGETSAPPAEAAEDAFPAAATGP